MRKTIVFLAVIILLSACGSVPLTGRRQLLLVSDTEILVASMTQFNDFISTAPLSTDATKTATVERVGRRIANATEAYLRQNGRADDIRSLQWDFRLVRDDQVNAFCMPGGKIVVYEGLLPLVASDDELAVVVGHEIAHAIARHSNERMSQQIMAQYGAAFVNMALSNKSAAIQNTGNTVFGLGAQLGVMLPYSRRHEYEADYMGMILMTMAGYEPASAVRFWEKMSAGGGAGVPEILSTHPSDAARIAEIRRRLPEMANFRR